MRHHRAVGRQGLYVQPGHLAEDPAVAGPGDQHPLHGGLHARQVHLQPLGELPAPFGRTRVAYGPRRVRGLVVEDEVGIAAHLAGGVEQQGGGVHGRCARNVVPTDRDP